MATFARLRVEAESPVRTCIDDFTPEGHFLATTKILGVVTTYLLAGTQDDPAAVVVGRIEHGTSFPTAYRGIGLKGGSLLSHHASEPVIFRAMVAE